MKKHLKSLIAILIIASIALLCTTCAFAEKTITMYSADGRQIEVDKDKVEDYQNVNWSLAPPITIYDKYGNTKQIIVEHLPYYVDDQWIWWTEPVTLMYTADGRTSYIMKSEVEAYSKVGWSTQPPVTLYLQGSGEKRSVLEHEVEDYLALGIYFKTYEEACPARFTYEPFVKSNLTVDQLNQALTNTGLAGQGQAFYDMEHTYNVNAIFAIGVACHESANGYKQANTNNFFGMRGGRGWMSFASPYDNIMYFGKLMNSSIYYGKSMEGIVRAYCPGDGRWIPCVKTHMLEKWNKISIGG